MRELKFRARWRDTLKPIPAFMDEYCLEALNDENLIVEQYTGLKDQQGTEIYEGDIVEWTDASGFEDGSAVVEWNESGAWYIVNDDDNIYDYLDDVLIDCEVIGNVHESEDDK